MKRGVAIVLASLQVGMATGARGQASSEPLTKEAIDLRRDGRDAEGLAVLERALAIDPSPRTRAQVGLAEQALGLWVEAERNLSAALTAGDDGWLLRNRDVLQSALDAIRARLATLSVETNVEGAELWLNGARTAVLPLSTPLRVVAGTVTIEVRALGYETQMRTIHVASQTRAREIVTLAERPRPQSPAAAGVRPSQPVATRASSVSMGEERQADDDGSGMRTGAWAALGGATVFLAGAGAALLVRDSNAATYNNDDLCLHGTLTRDQRCGSYREAATTAQTLAIVEVQAAAVAAGLAIVLFTVAPKRRENRVGAIHCTLAADLECGGTF